MVAVSGYGIGSYLHDLNDEFNYLLGQHFSESYDSDASVAFIVKKGTPGLAQLSFKKANEGPAEIKVGFLNSIKGTSPSVFTT